MLLMVVGPESYESLSKAPPFPGCASAEIFPAYIGTRY